jgi:diguanylate cyclase (GGDEF)-like protein
MMDRLRSPFGVHRTGGRARLPVEASAATSPTSADQALPPITGTPPTRATTPPLSRHGEILRAIIRGEPLAALMASVARLIQDEIAGSTAAIVVFDPDGQGVRVVAAPALPQRIWAAVERQAIRTTLAPLSGRASAQERRVVITPSVVADPSWDDWRESAVSLGLHASWSMAFIGSGDEVLGSIVLYFATASHPSRRELLLLGDVALLAASAMLRHGGAQSLRDHTKTNSITGLPNRVVLLERLRTAALRSSRPRGHFAIVQLAIDGLAQLNETLGHAAGDQVLRLTAQRLVATAGTSATVAHVWGVEFAVLVEDLASAEEASAVAARLDEVCREPYDIEGLAVSVSATVGVVSYSPETAPEAAPEAVLGSAREPVAEPGADAETGEPLLADGARLFGFHSQIVDAVAMAPDLRRGIDEHELSMVYQPIVDLSSGLPRRYEALLRWRSSLRGAVPPATFVPVAEQTGLVSDLGRYALREALAELSRLRVANPDVGISVNVSVRQLADEQLPVLLAQLMEAHDLPRGSVTLEVTEGVLLRGGAAGWRVLAGLREIGARIALDDFGTGFSQLSYLRQFWFDEIKIDRSFVTTMMRDVAARAIIVGVIAVADYAGSEVVAEGVERREQRAMLVELGATFGQGFLFGEPGPVRAGSPRD